jgi:AcrR family transcriptional regulator
LPVQPIRATTPLPRVRNSVFFTLPEALPRGRHKLSSEQVSAAQHERLLAAMTELLAAQGYRGFGAPDIARRAGVSLETYYGCFKNKDECVFAGYDRFIKILLTRMTAARSEDAERIELVHSLIGAYLETLQSDLVVARAYQVEIDALGAPARERRRQSLTLFARHLQQTFAPASPGRKVTAALTWSAYLGVVYAIRQLASDALESEARPDLRALQADAEVWLRDLFRER